MYAILVVTELRVYTGVYTLHVVKYPVNFEE